MWRVLIVVTVCVAGCSSSSSVTTLPSQVRCRLSLTNPSIVDASGGTSAFTVTTEAECVWDASPAADWITGLSPASGQGTRTVEFRVAPNDGMSPREGDILVTGERVRVSQRAPCRFDVSPANQRMGAGGGDGSAAIAAASDCAWSANTNAGWISLTPPITGNGTATLRFTVAPNGGSERTGAVIVGGQTSTITQAGNLPAPSPPAPSPSPSCSYAVAPATQSIGAAGGAGAPVFVSTQSGCPWTATSNAGWISVTSGASSSGSGSVTFTAAGNTGVSRSGTLSIAGQPVTVTQAACTYSLSPTSQSFAAIGGTGAATVTTLSACQWTGQSNASWIVVSSGASGTGNGSVAYAVGANTSSARTGTMSIAGQTFTVSQAAACEYDISPSDQAFGAGGGSGTINVSATPGCAWTSTSSASWITVQSGVTGVGTSRVTYSVDSNSGAARSGTIRIANQTFTVSQSGP